MVPCDGGGGSGKGQGLSATAHGRLDQRRRSRGSGGKAARALGARAAPTSPFASFCARVRFLIPIAFQQTNRPVPVVYSLNTEFQLCNNEKVFLMDPTQSEMSLAEMDYKGAFSKGGSSVLFLVTCSPRTRRLCLPSIHACEREG